ncbi:MAG: hypothetical protein KAX65_14230 [Caldilineaceae bacterium]|nr:hypothetical protein [Caldilineaceae bacterium]
MSDMGTYQRIQTIDLLLAETELDEDEFDRYADWELEVWLGELGFAWNDEAQCYEEVTA